MKFHHDKETPNLKTVFFKKNIHKLKKIKKTLIISGGSRNGNHLIWSLLDGNNDIPYLPGEDKFLSQIFWRNLKSSREFEYNLKKTKSSFLRKLSGLRSNKWIKIYNEKYNKKIWAGKHKPTVMPLLEFPESENKINYPAYKKYLDKNFKNKFSFYEIWDLYLNAQKLLANKNKKKHKYQFIYAESGLRRELLYLAENRFNFICLVPVRKFETFYFSKIKSIFNSTKINKEYIDEAWGHWYNKTSDYLYLKNKFPKKFLLIPYEDFSNFKTREKSIKKVCKFLKIKFNKINLINTHYKKEVMPNTSFLKKVKLIKDRKVDIDGYSTYKNLNYEFPLNKIPKNYFDFYNNLKKFFYK